MATLKTKSKIKLRKSNFKPSEKLLEEDEFFTRPLIDDLAEVLKFYQEIKTEKQFATTEKEREELKEKYLQFGIICDLVSIKTDILREIYLANNK